MTMENYLIYLLGGGALGVLGGIAARVMARIHDRRNYLVQKATPLPLGLVNVSDDVWLTGALVCESPIHPPHFGIDCVHFDYKLEEKVTETYRDSKGNTRTRTSWKTRQHARETAPFRLCEGEQEIVIDETSVEFQYLESRTDTVGSWRHTVKFCAYPSAVCAVGVVSEGKQRLEKCDPIPLIVTPLSRADYIKKVESSEKMGRRAGSILLMAGLVALFYGLFDHLGIPCPSGKRFSAPILLAAAIPSVLIFVVHWLIATFNTFVEYRQRVSNAWSQVDVDLAMRYQLIPQLVSVAQGYMTHERELLESLTRARTDAAAGRDRKLAVEGQVASQMVTLLARVEAYPDLKAQSVLATMAREMTAIEEKIAHGRTIYNEAVTEYNTTVTVFPQNLLATIFRFQPVGLFTLPVEQTAAPVVSGLGSC